jgi:lysophospholipase L1-like esterase
MWNDELNQRRGFLKQLASLGAIISGVPALASAMPSAKAGSSQEGDGYTFLFQGDSITDGNRSRNSDWNHVMGHGYAFLVASRLGFDFPKKEFRFFNRGISGNKVTDLAARWQKDTLELKPSLLSVLIGINDVSALINGDGNFGAEQFEKGYRELLQTTRQQLPDVQFVLCEPFILPVGKVKEKWAEYSREVEKRQEIVRKLSVEHQAIFVGFQKAFNKALAQAPAEYWIWDGIHPMPAGHELMAREWIQQVSKKLKFIKT